MTGQRRQRGFTLLELIVAAGILALIAVFSWRGLDALVREREALAASQATIDVLQRSFARIERDALLAGDVQLDDGTLRLVAGTSSIDGNPSATVDYRLVDGALTRSVDAVDRAPLVMIEGVTSLVMEAWAPAVRGGAWVHARGLARAPVATAPSANGAPVVYGTAAPPAAGASQTQSPSQTQAQAPGSPQPQRPPSDAATGIRLTFALADGSKLVRTFIVGGG